MQSCVVVVYGFCAFVVFCFLRFELHACALEVGFAVRFHNGRCPKREGAEDLVNSVHITQYLRCHLRIGIGRAI